MNSPMGKAVAEASGGTRIEETKAMIKELPTVFCDRCKHTVDERNFPIQSRACEHSICSDCLDAIVREKRGTMDGKKNDNLAKEGWLVDCHNCGTPNAFHTKNRHRNLMACSVMQVMTWREDFWGNKTAKLQERVQELQELLRTKSQPSEQTTTTAASLISTSSVDDVVASTTSTSHCPFMDSNSSTGNGKMGPKEQYHLPSISFLSSKSQLPFSESHDAKPMAVNQGSNKAAASTPALAPQNVAAATSTPSDCLRIVWVDFLCIRRKAYLVSVNGPTARIRWEGTDEEALVDIRTVHQLPYEQECLEKRPPSLPIGDMSHKHIKRRRNSHESTMPGKKRAKVFLEKQRSNSKPASKKQIHGDQQRKLFFEGKMTMDSPPHDLKIPLNSDDPPPFRRTTFITVVQGDDDSDPDFDHDSDYEPDNDIQSFKTALPRRRGRPPKNLIDQGDEPRHRSQPPERREASDPPVSRGPGTPQKQSAASASSTPLSKANGQPARRGPGRPRKTPNNAAVAEEAPIRRGPGRPRKSPVQSTAGSTVEEPVRRGPGRPRKNTVTTTVDSMEEPPIRRGPGRPRKNPVQSTAGSTVDEPVHRGPGRPRKNTVTTTVDSMEEPPICRGPGRPRKNSVTTTVDSMEEPPIRRGPGRPRKNTVPTTVDSMEEPPIRRGPGRPRKNPVQLTMGNPEEKPIHRGPGRPKKNPVQSTSATVQSTSATKETSPIRRGPGRPRKNSVQSTVESTTPQES